MTVREKDVRARYETALIRYAKAQEELKSALQAMHKIGEYPPPPPRLRFPLDFERPAATHKMQIGFGDKGIKGYLTSGTYSDGTLGEIFLLAEKQGSFVSGMIDSFATVFSIALQSGVPLDLLLSKLRYTRFEPDGVTRNPSIPIATSALDYLAQWLEQKYSLPAKEEESDGEFATETVN